MAVFFYFEFFGSTTITKGTKKGANAFLHYLHGLHGGHDEPPERRRRKRRLRAIRTAVVALSVTVLFATAAPAAELHFFAGAGLRQPVDALVDRFQRRTGHRVFVDYDGSGRLLARITASGRGDLFMPGSFFYIQKLLDRGGVRSWRPVVAHTPVIAVNRGTARRIDAFEDLAAPGVRLAMGDPHAMAFGKTAARILERSGLAEAVLANVTVYGATVKQLALYVAEGTVDAAIIGRTDAFQFADRVRMLPIPPAFFEAETVAAAVLDTTVDATAATALQDFLASPEALAVFTAFGFLTLEQAGLPTGAGASP